jgi:hypothetical protein
MAKRKGLTNKVRKTISGLPYGHLTTREELTKLTEGVSFGQMAGIIRTLVASKELMPTKEMVKKGRGEWQEYKIMNTHTAGTSTTSKTSGSPKGWKDILETFNKWYGDYEDVQAALADLEEKYACLDREYTLLREEHYKTINSFKEKLDNKDECIRKLNQKIINQNESLITPGRSFKTDPMHKMFNEPRTRSFNKQGG